MLLTVLAYLNKNKDILRKMLMKCFQRVQTTLIPIRSSSTWPITPSSSDLVVFEERHQAGIIILNRPKALNVFKTEMVKAIHQKLKAWQDRKAFILIGGVGEKAFCAGGDIQDLVKGNIEKTKEQFRASYSNFPLIGRYRKPYVSIIDGITMGGGVSLSGIPVTEGRFKVATENTVLSMPENAIGLFPDAGAGYFFPRLRGKLGYFLGLTGFRLKGSDVVKAGMATHFVERIRIPELVDELIKVQRSEEVEGILQKYNKVDSTPFSLEKHLGQIEECFSADSVEEIFERLQKDGSKWALETLKTLRMQSPTSLKVAKKDLDLGVNVSLEETLKRENRAGLRLIAEKKGDFFEGVRALVIDKDKNPKWNPDSVEKVSNEYVDSLFLPLSEEDELKFF